MKTIDSSNSAYLNSAWGMMNQVEVVKLLKEKKQSIIYHFEGEETRAVEQSGISALSGDQFTLHAGAEGTGNNVSSITGVELDGKITEEGTAFESSQRNNMAVDSDSKSATNQV